jgi:hypothetical protein
MDRKAARALAVATIQALAMFDLVDSGPPDSFAGKAVVALITSRSLELAAVARKLYTVTNQITVSIYVQRAPGAGAAAEDMLDDLALSVATALHDTGLFFPEQSDAGAAGAPSREIDGKIYRVERIPFTVLEEGGD